MRRGCFYVPEESPAWLLYSVFWSRRHCGPLPGELVPLLLRRDCADRAGAVRDEEKVNRRVQLGCGDGILL